MKDMPELIKPPNPSSNVLGIGYNKTFRKLYVSFKTSGIYIFEDVESATYKKLLEASHVGRFISYELTPKHFYRKIKQAT